ncbi:MAG: mevalonate kinase [Bacteroidetes bacterium]|nr:mevalonate kinase [Bacteroidota bacterium]
MKNISSKFYAKILLFGEYSVICDSMGLTIPYAHFEGTFSFINQDSNKNYDEAIRSNRHLKKYADHLALLRLEGEYFSGMDLEQLFRDIDAGLYFRSNIPQGYGIGSSGALVAAIYERYGNSGLNPGQPIGPEKTNDLKKTFALMESYFHGTSSGLDPLLCFLQRPLLIRNKTDIQFVNIPPNQFSRQGAIFLLDSGKPGKTQPLVKHFMNQCKVTAFNDRIQSELIPLNDQCITSLLKADTEVFTDSLQKLSAFQLHNFSAMIPAHFRNIWEDGLNHGKFSMKLCGSGGGGFMLAFANHYESAVADLQHRGLEFITVYKNSAGVKAPSFIFV